ncbi:hypothetical protein ACFL5Z_04885 [Planctomycetota bacterium]
MTGVTLTVAIVSSVLVLFLTPLHALIIYMATLLWYPTYLSAPFGTIDFTVHRIVILVLLSKLYLTTNLPNKLKWTQLDKMLLIYFMAQLLSGAIATRPFGSFLENRAGRICDMILPYLAIRLVITDRQKYLTFLKSIMVIAIPLAGVGIYQTISGHNPFGYLIRYSAWMSGQDYSPMSRIGLTRANVVFAHPIMFGLFFSMMGPLCVGLFSYGKKYHFLYWIGMGFICLGLFSCLSSGPAFGVLCAIAFMVFYRFRQHWKVLTVIIVIMCVVIEVISDRHFFEVIDRVTLNSATAWYRGRLIEVVLFEGGMRGHWITGFGYNSDPGWGARIDWRAHTDIVNHYILVLCRYGLIGLFPFFILNYVAIKKLIYSFKLAKRRADKWLVWCLASGLFGLWVAFNTVSLYDQPLTLYFIMLALCGAMPAVVAPPKLHLHGIQTLTESS